MKKQLLSICTIILIMACQSTKMLKDESHTILDIMQKQETAWNEGNLEGFMDGYWESESLTFVGKSGLSYGWQKVLDNYKKGYPDRDAMGRLKFDILKTDRTGADSYFVIGKWTLFRTVDTLAGHYTLLWKKVDGKWVIVTDHSS